MDEAWNPRYSFLHILGFRPGEKLHIKPPNPSGFFAHVDVVTFTNMTSQTMPRTGRHPHPSFGAGVIGRAEQKNLADIRVLSLNQLLFQGYPSFPSAFSITSE
jgi:hypothetical protein